MRRFSLRNVSEVESGKTMTMSVGNADRQIRTPDFRRCLGGAAPKVAGATAIVAGLGGLLALLTIAALAPVEALGGLRGAGASGLLTADLSTDQSWIASVAATLVQSDWLLRSFGIALGVAVASSLLTASTRDWQKLAEHDREGHVRLGALLSQLGGESVVAQHPAAQRTRSESVRVPALSGSAVESRLRELEQRLRSLRATNLELLGGPVGLATEL